MKLLETQALFEELWNNTGENTILDGLRNSDRKWIVYFTAKWCGPCRQIDVEKIDEATVIQGLTLWKCDIDVNDYTPGYCGVRSVPTFLCFEPKKIVSKLQSNNTEEILNWLTSL